TMLSHRIPRTHGPTRRSAVLRLEGLERRWCPSCTVTVTGTLLSIIGGAGNNNLAVVDNGAGGIFDTCDGAAQPAANGIQQVFVNTGAGNDTVTYSRSAAGGTFMGRLAFNAMLGSGNDTFTANFNGNGLAGTARVTFNVAGNTGDDKITFNAGTTAAGVNVAAGGRLGLMAQGGAGIDTITVNYAGKLDGNLNINARGGAGDDTVAATIALAAGGTGSLMANENGGAGSDTLTLSVTGPIAAGARADLRADGGAGNDKVTVSYAGVLGGKLGLRARGGDGDDTVAATVAL